MCFDEGPIVVLLTTLAVLNREDEEGEKHTGDGNLRVPKGRLRSWIVSHVVVCRQVFVNNLLSGGYY